ncbi:MAG TPA: PspA/IM30 family protein [Fimbriimonadaceae bacterium]|nr:PspA/IM30 family protein [Fimbriimonadaceae bacterium]
MRRFFNWLKGLFNKTMDKIEDPEVMLDQARRDMQQTLIANKEKAVQAITQKNRLEQMLGDAKNRSTELEKQASMALKQGKRDLATQLMREKINNDGVIAQLQTSYDQAVATVDAVKTAIRRQDEEVRKKTAEALALKAQWKQAQIQSSISKALDGLTFENQFEGFGAAAERINMAKSEAAARQEMQSESIQGKIMALQDASADAEAEEAVAALEQRLGLAPAAAAPAEQAQSVTLGASNGQAAQDAALQSEAEKQIAELEKRMQS